MNMKKKFKYFGAFLLVMFVVSLSACTDNENNPADKTNQEPVAKKLSYEKAALKHLMNSTNRLCRAVHAENLKIWMNARRPDAAELVAETINTANQDGCFN